MQDKFPSIKAIMHIKGATLEAAKIVHSILTATNRDTLECLPVYETYYQKTGIHMYHPHNLSELKIQLINIVLTGYGVEGFKTDDNGYCDYVNFGDTYDTTILYFQGRFSVGCWGDIAERYTRGE